MRSIRSLVVLFFVFLALLSCKLLDCPTCTDLEAARVRECENLYGPGAIVIGFQCGYSGAENPCGVVQNRGQCNFNGIPQDGVRETIGAF